MSARSLELAVFASALGNFARVEQGDNGNPNVGQQRPHIHILDNYLEPIDYDNLSQFVSNSFFESTGYRGSVAGTRGRSFGKPDTCRPNPSVPLQPRISPSG